MGEHFGNMRINRADIQYTIRSLRTRELIWLEHIVHSTLGDAGGYGDLLKRKTRTRSDGQYSAEDSLTPSETVILKVPLP